MNVDLIFQIAGVGIIVAVLNQLLTRAGRDEQALLTTIAGLVAVLFILSQQIGDLFDTVKNIFSLYVSRIDIFMIIGVGLIGGILSMTVKQY